MSGVAEIKKLLREVVGVNPNLPVVGVVKSVGGDSCTVTLASGLDVSDVKLKATMGGDDYVVLTPKVGSIVTMLSLSGDVNNMVVVKMDEAEKMEYNQNGLVILADSTDGKVSIKNKSVSLFEILTDLKTLISQLTVSTPNGPSGTPLPPTIAALEQFETKFKQLLKAD